MQTNPITITSFYPFQNFLRVSQEFYEDKAIVKVKSLTFEREFDVDYMELGEISDKYHVDENQIGFGFVLLSIITVIFIFFFNDIWENQISVRVAQGLYISAIAILVTGFKKSWQINLCDKKGNILTWIKQTNKNAGLVSQALELITNKNEEVREVTVTGPFPEDAPVFEQTENDIAYFAKTTSRFYDEKIITLHQTLFKEVVWSTQYSQLSGKVFRGKVSAIPWFSYFCNFLYAGVIIMGLDLVFNLGIGINILLFYKLGLIIFFIFFLLKYVKKEVVGLYDHDENIIYGINVNSKNRVDVEKIIDFIHSQTHV